MIDSIGAEYNIDRDRVYATGHSMGAFFSIHLAGRLSDKVAAIASVCGSMTQVMYDSSAPVHPMPYLEVHGTADPLVPYNGANPLYLSIPDVLEYWVDYNNCDTIPMVTPLPDIDTTDGSTVERQVYAGGDSGVTVEHLKVIGGGHSWPGTPGANRDVDASEEIWNFLSRYDIHGLGDACDCPIDVNGDVNADSTITAADIVYLVNYVFKGGPAPAPCPANGNVNCDGAVTAADIVYLVQHVFNGGPPPCDICNGSGALGGVPNP
jgi:hypothetical protein